MKLIEKSDQFLPKGSIKQNTKKILTLVIGIPLFLLAGQRIVTADRSESTINAQINQPKIQSAKISQSRIIRTAVYNQYASVTYFSR